MRLNILVFLLFFISCKFSNCLAENIDSNSPFEKLLGDRLYKLSDDLSEIKVLSTKDALKNKKTIGLYFSASWCGPCRKFTPLLSKFYQDMNKKNKKFEVIWISRDNSQGDYFSYFQSMPWLAIPYNEVDSLIQNLSKKYHLQGIPHLVILDGIDASVYTLNGREMVLKDKFGVEFPWRPKSIKYLVPRFIRSWFSKKITDSKNRLQKMFIELLRGLFPAGLLKLAGI